MDQHQDNPKQGTNKFDVAIIGAGPIGLACAIACKKLGLTHIVIDKGTLVNSIFNYPLNMSFFSTSDKLEIGDVPFISHYPKPTRDEALEYFRRVALHWKINTRLFEKVESVLKKDGEFEITTIKGRYTALSVIVSTGFYDVPNLLDVPGEELPKVHHYYKEPHLYYDQKVLVVGAANSAVDVALETYRKGAHVTMVMRENAIQENVKYWVRPDIENRIKEGGIKAYFNSQISAITEHEVELMTPAGIVTIDNDFVLAMTGYKPDFTFLRSIGVELVMTSEACVPAHDPDSLETNVPGIFLSGVILGGSQTSKWFIENSRAHADIVAEQVLRRKHKMELQSATIR
jgi:thioredoxin reductase (NADPH)